MPGHLLYLRSLKLLLLAENPPILQTFLADLAEASKRHNPRRLAVAGGI
jgi:hypothetical protein